MTYKKTAYVARPVDSYGVAEYSLEDDRVWQTLFSRQTNIIQGRACEEYFTGLEALRLPVDRVPQCPEVSHLLKASTGWILEPVPALISFKRFFELLADRRFPAATFIRRHEELDYIQEPDIFHEIFGHCPLLMNKTCADFTHAYGKLGLTATPEERVFLARLYWFTIEFGLINTQNGIRAYGGGMLSSINETVYSLESHVPERRPFNVTEVLQTAYRIDVLQPIYFVLDHFDQLYNLLNMDLISLIHEMNLLNNEQPLHPC